MEKLGDRLKYLREDVLGLSVEQLRDRLRQHEPAPKGASHGSISRYERGERMPGVDYVRVLAEMTGQSLEWIIFGPSGNGFAAAASARPFMERVAEAVDDWRCAIREAEADARRRAEEIRQLDEERRRQEAEREAREKANGE